MPALPESHTNPKLGVTMREKESLVVTESHMVVLMDKEVKKRSSCDSQVIKSTLIFSNRTLSECVVHVVDFSQEN